MREHKYKAKRLDGQWVEGYYWQNWCGNHFIRTTIEYGRIMIKDYEIEPKTLCEFIGLYDKNKKEVWEHDIIDHWEGAVKLNMVSGIVDVVMTFMDTLPMMVLTQTKIR